MTADSVRDLPERFAVNAFEAAVRAVDSCECETMPCEHVDDEYSRCAECGEEYYTSEQSSRHSRGVRRAVIALLESQLATANEHREAVTEKLEAAQMHNYRQNERIAKMRAVLGTTHVTLTSIRDTARLYPCCDQSTTRFDLMRAIAALRDSLRDAL